MGLLRFWADCSAEPMTQEVRQYSAIMLSCGPAHRVTSPRLSLRRFLVSGPVPTCPRDRRRQVLLMLSKRTRARARTHAEVRLPLLCVSVRGTHLCSRIARAAAPSRAAWAPFIFFAGWGRRRRSHVGRSSSHPPLPLSQNNQPGVPTPPPPLPKRGCRLCPAAEPHEPS